VFFCDIYDAMLTLPNFAITPAQQTQLKTYAQLVRQWNPKINLIAPSTLPELETRHILDSAQLAPHLQTLVDHSTTRPSTIDHTVLDVGSGAGLPGLVLAVLMPHIHFTLAERDQRKAAFLLTARHTLGLTNVHVHVGDVATLAPKQFEVITARAWASLSDIITLTSPLLAQKGSWLLLKGEAVQAEITAYAGPENVTFTATPSITNPKACVLHVQRRASA
jgi:16S rRNA (guanine527-N7)-methyltransferase